MTLQKAVDFTEYFRCYVIGQEKVRVMHYDPRRPHAERYVKNRAAHRTGYVRARGEAMR